MTDAAQTLVDPLASLADAAQQKLAAQMAQDAFAAVFQQSARADDQASAALAEIETRCHNWSRAAAGEEAPNLRLALLISGLDQWGLAYSQAFNVTAIPALTLLLGNLRQRLGSADDACFQQYFMQVEQTELAAIDFKIDLRRNIHLALWHAMAACETLDEGRPILLALGGLLKALDERMPTLGWRLVADALASMQMALLQASDLSAVAQQGTQQLFEALKGALPADRYAMILAHAGQAVVAWQRARRPQ